MICSVSVRTPSRDACSIKAKLTLPELRRMTEIFQTARTPFRLAHDPDCTTPEDGTIVYKQAADSESEIGQLFKRYRDAGLLRPTDTVARKWRL
jgi:hypothetical protein